MMTSSHDEECCPSQSPAHGRRAHVPAVTVREAAEAEADAVAVLLRAAFAAFEPLYTPEAFAATVPPVSEITRRRREGPVWVAVLDGLLVGTVSVVPVGDALYVRSMAVHPSARGRGMAVRLLAEAERFAAAHALRRLRLSTTPFLSAAIRLYERAGFVRTDEGPHDLFGTPLFTMEKAVPIASPPSRLPA